MKNEALSDELILVWNRAKIADVTMAQLLGVTRILVNHFKHKRRAITTYETVKAAQQTIKLLNAMCDDGVLPVEETEELGVNRGSGRKAYVDEETRRIIEYLEK